MARNTKRRQPSTESELTPYAAQVLKAVDKGLDLFTEPGSVDFATFGLLAEVTRQVRPLDWNENPTRAFKWVMASAVDKLPDANPDRKDPLAYRTTWRHVGRTICGFREDLKRKADGNSFKPSDLKDVVELEAEAYLKPRSYERRLYVLYELLAEILREMQLEYENRSIIKPSDGADKGFEIARPLLVRDFIRAFEGGSPLVWIHGRQRVGKTALVRYVLNTYPRNAIWIDCSDTAKLHDKIAIILDQYGVSTACHDAVLRVRFCRLLCDSNLGCEVVLDGFTTDIFPEIIETIDPYRRESFVRRNYNSRVTVISRRVAPVNIEACSLEVEELTHLEAETFAATYLQNQVYTAVDFALFMTAVGRSPGTLFEACRSIRKSGRTIAEYTAATDHLIGEDNVRYHEITRDPREEWRAWFAARKSHLSLFWTCADLIHATASMREYLTNSPWFIVEPKAEELAQISDILKSMHGESWVVKLFSTSHEVSDHAIDVTIGNLAVSPVPPWSELKIYVPSRKGEEAIDMLPLESMQRWLKLEQELSTYLKGDDTRNIEDFFRDLL